MSLGIISIGIFFLALLGMFWHYHGRKTSGGMSATGVTPPPAVLDLHPHYPERLAQVSVAELLRLFQNPSDREDAYIQLAMRVTGEHARSIASLIYDDMPSAYGYRIIWLVRLAGPAAYGELLARQLRQHSSMYVRRAAVTALAEVPSTVAAHALSDALREDPAPEVRRAAAHALVQAAGAGAKPVLHQAMERDTDRDVQDICQFLLGEGNLQTIDPRPLPGQVQVASWQGFQYLVYLPRNYTGGRPVPLLVSVHGTSGRAAPYVDMWRTTADAHGVAVIAPWYDAGRFPNYDLPALPRDRVQSDQCLLNAIAHAGRTLNIQTEEFSLFGHSKGGQFVSRFVYLHPDRIKKAVISGAGHFLRVEEDVLFPAGLKPHPWRGDIADWDFSRVIAMDLLVMCGADDLNRRYRAARDFIDESTSYAEEHGVDNRIEFLLAQNVPHAGARSQPIAAEYFFHE